MWFKLWSSMFIFTLYGLFRIVFPFGYAFLSFSPVGRSIWNGDLEHRFTNHFHFMVWDFLFAFPISLSFSFRRWSARCASCIYLHFGVAFPNRNVLYLHLRLYCFIQIPGSIFELTWNVRYHPRPMQYWQQGKCDCTKKKEKTTPKLFFLVFQMTTMLLFFRVSNRCSVLCSIKTTNTHIIFDNFHR